jgi:hypothetical protein
VRKGLAERSHFSVERSTPAYYVPSSVFDFEFELLGEDDDAADMMSWALSSGRKARH